MTGTAAASPRRELAILLACGALGAGGILLASRQELAKVIVRAPRPLPDTVTSVSAQDLRPAIAALAVAALASLAAVLATRGVLRRMTGLITVALGAGVAVLAAGQVTAGAALAAAGHAGASPASGSGAGTAPGSVTAGNGATGPTGSLAGLPVHVVLGGWGWRALIIAAAVLVVAAGAAIVVRGGRLPVMSGRYDRQAGSAAAAVERRPERPRHAASMWESLSAGADPTAGPE